MIEVDGLKVHNLCRFRRWLVDHGITWWCHTTVRNSTSGSTTLKYCGRLLRLVSGILFVYHNGDNVGLKVKISCWRQLMPVISHSQAAAESNVVGIITENA